MSSCALLFSSNSSLTILNSMSIGNAQQLRGSKRGREKGASACFKIRSLGQERGGFQTRGKLKANFFIVHSTE